MISLDNTKLLVGLTGGICCGKSTVAKVFIDNQIPVVDADQLAREVVVPGSEGLQQIISSFGKKYIQENGTLDRIKLADLVFSDTGALSALNMIMLPLVQASASEQFYKLLQAGERVIIYDAPLICETGSADKYRPLVVVSCPTETQVQRLIKRNGLTDSQARVRIAAQMSTEEKVKLADFVINTDCSLEATKEQVIHLVDRLRLMV